MEKKARQRTLAGWAVGIVIASVAILPICDLSFDCDCRLPGLGGYSHCDIHTAGPPDCPWCEKPLRFGVALLVSFGAALVGVFRLPARARFGLIVLTGLSIAWLVTLLAGVVTSLLLGRAVLAGL